MRENGGRRENEKRSVERGERVGGRAGAVALMSEVESARCNLIDGWDLIASYLYFHTHRGRLWDGRIKNWAWHPIWLDPRGSFSCL